MNLRALSCLVPLVAAAACDPSGEITVDVSVDAAAVPADEPPAVDGVQYGAAYTPDLWNKSLLTVCFFDFDPTKSLSEKLTLAQSRALELATRVTIQQAVDGTWGARTRFTFQWLGTCGPSGADIRIVPTAVGVLGWSPFGTGSLADSMKINFPCEGSDGHCSESEPDPNGGALCKLGSYIAGNIPPADQPHCLSTSATHEFGHALGLMHEHERPDNTCGLAPNTTTLTPLWDYDPYSRMNYCAPDLFSTHALSAGDVRTINTLYPLPVRVDLPGGDKILGLGVYSDGPYDVRGLVISPGYEVRLCSSNNVCTSYTETTGQDQLAAKIIVTSKVWGFEFPGYRGRNAQFGLGINTGAKINAACNDCMSSMVVPHGLEARVCFHDNGTHCTTLRGGPEYGPTDLRQLPAEYDNQISFVEVTPKVVIYRDRNFVGTGKTFAVDARIANPLTGASSVLVGNGYHARVCTQVVGGNGAGTCQVLTASGNLDPALDNNVAFLETFPAPIVWEPPPGPVFPPF